MEKREKPNKEVVATARKGRLVRLLDALTEVEGISQSSLPGVKLMCSSLPKVSGPASYEPGIVIVAQGRKRGTLGDTVFTYDANHFLVLSVPLPFACETVASPDGPMLGLYVCVNPVMIVELLMTMEGPAPASRSAEQAICANPLSQELYNSAVRLAETLASGSGDDARVLGPQLIREIAYRVLCAPGGEPLRALAAPHSHFGRISRILHRIHADFARPVEMASLASEAGMSLSTFHTHFKSVTGSPPLQYLKSIRLHKARSFMLQDGETAASAARRVGYESASQFSREFKSYFGETPAAETERLRSSLIRLG